MGPILSNPSFLCEPISLTKWCSTVELFEKESGTPIASMIEIDLQRSGPLKPSR
jgi:hypothetical protein